MDSLLETLLEKELEREIDAETQLAIDIENWCEESDRFECNGFEFNEEETHGYSVYREFVDEEDNSSVIASLIILWGDDRYYYQYETEYTTYDDEGKFYDNTFTSTPIEILSLGHIQQVYREWKIRPRFV